MLSAERIALLKHGAPPRNALEAALRNVWYGGGGASYEKTVGPAPIISISDAKAKPAKSLIVGMEPIQDLHGYGSPWPAGGGSNQFDEVWESGSFNGNDGTPVVNAAWSRSVNYISVEPETNYYCNFESVGDENGYYLFFYRADNSFISLINRSANSIVTTPADSVKCKIQYKRTIETVGNYKVAINYPSSVTTYAPYSNLCPITGRTGVTVDHSGADTSDPTTYAISWNTEAGTVYGGTVDLVSGLLTVDMLLYDFGGSTWNPVNNTETSRTQGLFISTLPNAAKSVLNYSYDDIPNIISDTFKTQANLYFFDTGRNPGEATFSQYLKQIYVNWSALSGKTNEEAKAILTGIIACYELETPQTYQLTPTQIQMLKGANVLWSTADDLTLTYIGTTPANLLGGMLGGGLDNPQEPVSEEPTEETSEELEAEPVSEEPEAEPEAEPTEGDGE